MQRQFDSIEFGLDYLNWTTYFKDTVAGSQGHFELNVYNYPEDVVSAHEMEDLVKSLLPEQQTWEAGVPALAE